MATVYKVELEIVSHWTSFPPKEMRKIIENAIINHVDLHVPQSEVEIKKVIVEITA